MYEWFHRHPRSVGETYVVHALVPALCEYTGSRTISALHARMVLNRRKAGAPFELDYAI